MSISSLRKIVRAKAAIRTFNSYIPKYRLKPDYEKFVKISDKLDTDTFNYVSSLKSTIGNYAKHNNLEVVISPADKKTQSVKIDIFAKENPVIEKIANFLEMIRPEPLRMNESDIVIKVNPKDKNELTAPSRKIFAAISDTVKRWELVLNSNLK